MTGNRYTGFQLFISHPSAIVAAYPAYWQLDRGEEHVNRYFHAGMKTIAAIAAFAAVVKLAFLLPYAQLPFPFFKS